VLQYQWWVLGTFGGLALAVIWIMCPLALWGDRERRETGREGAEQPGAKRNPAGAKLSWDDTLRVFPWVLTLSILAFMAYQIIQTIYYMFYPPNI
jgi:hypothetical protein